MREARTPAHEVLETPGSEGDLVLTAASAELQKFLLEYAAEPCAFAEETVLPRVRYLS